MHLLILTARLAVCLLHAEQLMQLSAVCILIIAPAMLLLFASSAMPNKSGLTTPTVMGSLFIMFQFFFIKNIFNFYCIFLFDPCLLLQWCVTYYIKDHNYEVLDVDWLYLILHLVVLHFHDMDKLGGTQCQSIWSLKVYKNSSVMRRWKFIYTLKLSSFNC